MSEIKTVPAEKVAFTRSVLTAMGKYVDQKSGIDKSEPVNYQGRAIDGFVNILSMEGGMLFTGFCVSTKDLAHALDSMVNVLASRTSAKDTAQLMTLLAAKLLTDGPDKNIESEELEVVSEPAAG
jgi:hypothetical protein